jgi:hypothetical protein
VTTRIALLSVLLTAFVLSACGGRLNGVVDYDHERDFVSIKKLGFYEDVKPLERRQDATRVLVRAEIAKQLAARGYEFPDAAEAELQIIYHVGSHSKIGVGAGAMSSGETATLAIEFRDPQSGRSVWYGTVEQTWKEGLDVDERVTTAVSVLLKRFPPETTRSDMLLKTNQGEERQSE